MVNDKYQKLMISMRYWLLGMSHNNKQFLVALEAFEYAKNYHVGMRKDGKTPEFQHQIEIAHYLRTMIKDLKYPAETLACVFLHDVAEDYDVSFDELEKKFGAMVSKSTYLLTKKYRGEKKTEEQYFGSLAFDPIGSVLKGADRINNQQSMTGVFSVQKQEEYIRETQTYIIPMLKKARHLHVEQESVYENIKFVLNAQTQLINVVIGG